MAPDLTPPMLARLSQLLDRHGIAHAPLVAGAAHLNLSVTDGDRVHLKVGRVDAWPERAQVEVDAARWVRSHGVLAPEPLLDHAEVCPDDDGVDRPVTVWRSLGPETCRPGADLVVATLAKTVRQQQQVPSPAGATVFDLALFTARIRDRLAGDRSAAAAAMLATTEMLVPRVEDAFTVSPHGWMHADLHPENLHWVAAGPVVIDWESACVGPLVWDLGQIIRSVHTDPGLGLAWRKRVWLAETWMVWARKTFGVSRDQIEAVAAYRAVSAASHLYLHGHRPDHLAGMLAYLRHLGYQPAAA